MNRPFPKIPNLAPRDIHETPRAFGLRAFQFLMRERVVAGLLDTDVLEDALAASHLIIVAPEMSELVREQVHTVRLDMATTIDRRKREQREHGAAAPPKSSPFIRPNPSGRARRPVPITPTSPEVAKPF